MDSLKIGETIRELRANRGFTQAELGELVGVSPGAVSKWENSASLPDLQLIMPIARALGVSTDSLLCYENALDNEKIGKIEKELTECFSNKGYEQGAELSREYLKRYPSSMNLALTVANLMAMYVYMVPQEDVKYFYGTIKKLQKRVADSGDPSLSSVAMSALAYSHLQLEEYEDCERILKSIPNAGIDSSAIWLSLLERQNRLEEAELLCKETLLLSTSKVTMSLSVMARLVSEKDIDTSLLFLETVESINNALQIPMPVARLSIAKLLVRKEEYSLAAENYLGYVETLVKSPYDFNCHPFLYGLTLSHDEDSQMPIRKAMYRDLLENPGELSVLSDEPSFKKAVEILDNELKL